MKPGEIEIVMRAVVPVADVRDAMEPHLEATEDDVWLSRAQRGTRMTFRGVPAKRVDVVIVDGYALTQIPGEQRGEPSRTVDSPVCIVEIGRKSGRFDGAERDRITVRPVNTGMVRQLAIREGRLFTLAEVKPTVTVRLDTTDADETPLRWQRRWDRLRWELESAETGGHARIVMYHWSHFYQHLDADTATALAASFVAPEGATLAEANRAASRLLYRASRDAGWYKLTARERAKLRLDGAQWQTEAVVAERRAALAGMRADGVGEATHAAAATGAWSDAPPVEITSRRNAVRFEAEASAAVDDLIGNV